MASKLGLTHIYTGDGKGKTTAGVGLLTRAIGQGCKVACIQFMKGGAYTGEMVAAKNFLPNFLFEQHGRHCIKEEKQLKLLGFNSNIQYFDYIRDDIKCGSCRWCFLNDELQKKYVMEALQRSKEVLSEGYDVVLLDEIITAVNFKFLDDGQVVDLINNKNKDTELILTGRGSTEIINNAADYVTEMKQLKHPFDKGTFARRAIEY